MSTATVRPALAVPRRRLVEVVTTRRQRRARPRIVHALVAVLGVLAIVGIQLLLSIVVSSGAYRVTELQAQQRELVRVGEDIQEALEIRSATQYLATSAASLGMVPAASLGFLRLEDRYTWAAPGFRDVFGCGGACGLVPNSLIAGLPSVQRPPAPGQENAPAVVPGATTTPLTADAGVETDAPPPPDLIPAPVTH